MRRFFVVALRVSLNGAVKAVLAVLICLGLTKAGDAQAPPRAPQSTNLRRHLVPPPDVPARDAGDPAHRMLVGNSQVRAFRVEVAPHATTASAQHGHDYFVVAIDASRVRMLTGGRQFSFEMQRGDVQVMKGGWPHRVCNDSENELRVVEVEVARGIDPEHALCGIGGHSCSDSAFGRSERGNYLRTTLMETGSIKVHRVQLDAGVELPHFATAGEAMVVALSDVNTATLHLHAGEAGWEPRSTHLANSGAEPAEFLLLEWK